jgi:hypothetical protein
MAYETGTAAGHIDLLTKLRTFLTTNAELVAAGQNWEEKLYQEVPGVSGQYETILRGPGLADDDDIYVGIRTYASVASDYYNWQLNGYTGYDAGLTFTTQPGTLLTYFPRMYLTNGNITYWFIANGRRFIVAAKVSTVYETIYMGLILPYLPDTLLPYPLFIAGCGTTAALRWSSSAAEHRIGIAWPLSTLAIANALLAPASSACFYDATWYGIQNYSDNSTSHPSNIRAIWPTSLHSGYDTNYFRSNYDDSYTLFPLTLYNKNEGVIWGELDGCYYVSGYNNSAENIIAVSGYDHLVIPDISRFETYSYVALKTQVTVTTTTTTTTTSSSSTTTTTAP